MAHMCNFSTSKVGALSQHGLHCETPFQKQQNNKFYRKPVYQIHYIMQLFVYKITIFKKILLYVFSK